jgi:hypothetical protein
MPIWFLSRMPGAKIWVKEFFKGLVGLMGREVEEKRLLTKCVPSFGFVTVLVRVEHN